VARVHRARRTLAGTFEARDEGPRCRLVVTLDDRGVLRGHMTFATLRLWLRGAHANRGRLGVGALSSTRDGAPLAWVRLRAVGDTVWLDLDPVDRLEPAPKDGPSGVVFGRLEEEE
jgi:hypothetical protein